MEEKATIKLTYNPTLPGYAREKVDTCFLLKFFSEEWQRNYFLSGKLYMRQHTEFAKGELGKGRYDITEGADIVALQRSDSSFIDIRFVPSDSGEVYVQINELTEKPEGYRENQAFISYPVANQKRNLFCMYTLWLNKQEGCVFPLDISSLSDLGEYGVLITNQNEFLNRVGKAINQRNDILSGRCGFVEYFSDDQSGNVMNMNPFLKPAEGYSHQNEFRICVETDNTNLLELDLGKSIIDIAVPVRLSTFSQNLQYNEGRLLFKYDIEGCKNMEQLNRFQPNN